MTDAELASRTQVHEGRFMNDAELGDLYNDAHKNRPPAGHYVHYRGGRYRLANIVAMRESDLVPCVYYEDQSTGICFFRPLAEWSEPVTLPDGTTVPRFRRVES